MTFVDIDIKQDLSPQIFTKLYQCGSLHVGFYPKWNVNEVDGNAGFGHANSHCCNHVLTSHG